MKNDQESNFSPDIREEQTSSELRSAAEIGQEKELQREQEIVPDRETGSAEEQGVGSESSGKQEKTDNTRESESASSSSGSSGGASGAAGAAGGISGAIAAVVAVVVVVTSGMFGNLSAKIAAIQMFGTFLEYEVSVEMDYTPDAETEVNFNCLDTGMILSVANNKSSRYVLLCTDSTELDCAVDATDKGDGSYHLILTFTGKVEGLDPGTSYKVQVIGDENGSTKTYATQTVKTTAPVTEFTSVSYVCKCTVDGNFYFTLNYLDENAFYHDFTYEMKSRESGEVVASGTIDDPAAEQCLPGADDWPGNGYILTITFQSDSPSDIEKGEQRITVTLDVEV